MQIERRQRITSESFMPNRVAAFTIGGTYRLLDETAYLAANKTANGIVKMAKCSRKTVAVGFLASGAAAESVMHAIANSPATQAVAMMDAMIVTLVAIRVGKEKFEIIPEERYLLSREQKALGRVRFASLALGAAFTWLGASTGSLELAGTGVFFIGCSAACYLASPSNKTFRKIAAFFRKGTAHAEE